MSYLLGLDVGTTGCKAIVLDPEGEVKSYGFQEYEVVYPKIQWAEQSPETVWNSVKKVVKEAIEKANVKMIKAIGLSVQGDAIIPVDKNIEPLYPAILGMDYRSNKEAEECSEVFGDRYLFEKTGMRPHPMNSLTKILWLKRHKRDVYNKTYKFMTYADFILAKLGVDSKDPVIDFTMASRTMAFDLKKREWSQEILSKLDIDESLFSRPLPSGRIVGEISAKLADELNIDRGTLLVTGGHDQTCAGIGAGLVKEGISLDSHGSAEVISTALNKPYLNELMYESYYPCYIHAKENMYFTFALLHVSGIIFRWYRDNFAFEEIKIAKNQGRDPYDLITERLSREPSCLFVLPHFNGSGTPYCDLTSKGAILGLNLKVDKYDIAKAIMEGLTYELKINIERMKLCGIDLGEVRCVGGASKSSFWLQLKADILDMPIYTLKVKESACLGSAILAGYAVGIYNSIEEGVERAVKIDKEYIPDGDMSKIYKEKYNIYREIYHILKPLNQKIV